MLVLGCGIKGEKLLPTLQKRLDKCLDYLSRNPDAFVVVSGGKGRGEAISEAEAMKRYLVSKGIDAIRVWEENQSKNTKQNMQFSKILLDSCFSSGNYSAVCITSDYHIYRAERLSKQVNLPVSVYPARTTWYLYPAAYCRETLSICKMWMALFW